MNEKPIVHLDFGAAVAHRASGRVGRFVVYRRWWRTDGAYVYFPGDGRPRWVPAANLVVDL
jgi:hypothetical protein